MPIDKINVATGKLAVWHRFDSPVESTVSGSVTTVVSTPVVIKDRHELMSVTDIGIPVGKNAWDQIEAIWKKLGGTYKPPRVSRFSREDLGKNAASQVPGTFPAPVVAFTGTTLLAFWLDLNFDIGGAAPTGVEFESTPTLGGAAITGTFTLTYPYLWLGLYSVWAATGLTAGTSYSTRGRLINPFGSGGWSTPTVHSTPA